MEEEEEEEKGALIAKAKCISTEKRVEQDSPTLKPQKHRNTIKALHLH